VNHLSRSTALKTAAVLVVTLGLFGAIANIPYLAQGAAAINGANEPPYFVVVVGFAVSILSLIGAYGLWHQQRWGIILTVLLHAVDALLSAPGILFAPTLFTWWASLMTTLLDLIIIVLCFWRERKPVAA